MQRTVLETSDWRDYRDLSRTGGNDRHHDTASGGDLDVRCGTPRVYQLYRDLHGQLHTTNHPEASTTVDRSSRATTLA